MQVIGIRQRLLAVGDKDFVCIVTCPADNSPGITSVFSGINDNDEERYSSIMTTWPVPGSESAVVQEEGKPGSFWEDRGDRFHCGVDIYAPAMSDVLACENGEVIDVGIATSPELVSYMDTTRYVLIKTRSNLYCRYAELADVLVHIGDRVLEGQVIGHIGTVIRPHLVDSCSPVYVQRLKLEGHVSMLHFEVYRLRPGYMRLYIGGNWFGSGRPEGLLDPGPYLRNAVHGIEKC